MTDYELNDGAKDTLLSALDGYYDHNLSYSIEEAEKALRSGRLPDGASEWTQEDLDRLKRQEANVKVLYEAIQKGQISISGEGVELPTGLRSDPTATLETHETMPEQVKEQIRARFGADPEFVRCATSIYDKLEARGYEDQLIAQHIGEAFSDLDTVHGDLEDPEAEAEHHARKATDRILDRELAADLDHPAAATEFDEGSVIYDELVTDHEGNEQALVIEEIAGEYQSYARRRELNGDWGKTGDVAQFPQFEQADAHRAALKHQLTGEAEITGEADQVLNPAGWTKAQEQATQQQIAVAQMQQQSSHSGPGVG